MERAGRAGGPAGLGRAAIGILAEKRIKRLPVVDEHGHLMGIVSRRDLLRPGIRPDPEIHVDVVEEVLDTQLGTVRTPSRSS